MEAVSANETGFLKPMDLDKGSIPIMDRGLNKYPYFDHLDKSGWFFVTWKKTNTRYDILETKDVEQGSDIIKDKVILRKYKELKVSWIVKLRLITYKDLFKGEVLEFLTNLMEVSAKTIGRIYDDR